MLLVVAGAAVLRLFRLDFQNLWVDEMMSVHVAMPEGYTIWQLTAHNIHGPLHTFVLYLFTFLGTSDWWLRFPSAVAGIGSVWMIYRWVQLLCGENVARAAAVLLAVSPLHIYYSQEVRNYSFVVFFALVTCYLLERLVQRAGRGATWQYGAAAAAALLCNFSAAFLIGAQTGAFFIRKGIHWATVRQWIWIGLIVVAITSPWIYRVYTNIDVSALVTPVHPGELQESERLRGETTVSAASVPYALYAFSVGLTLGPSLRELHEDSSLATVLRHHGAIVLWVALLFGTLAVSGIAAAIRRRLPWPALAIYLLIPIAGTIMLNWQNAKAFNVRYILVALPAYLCLVAIGIASLSRWWRIAVWVLVLGTSSLSLYHHYFDTRYHKEDVRGAVRYVEKRIGPDECFFAPTVRNVAKHYYTGSKEITSLFRGALSQQQLEDKLDRILDPCPSMWYMRARPWVLDPDGALKDRIWSRYEEVEAVEFEGVTVFHMVLRKSL